MIRINLISEGRRPVVARKARPKMSLGGQDPSLMILVAGLVVGLLIGAGWYFTVKSQLEAVNVKIQKAKKEIKELEPILKEVKDFKKKKRELNNKIEIIQDLHKKRRGPVEILDRVSKALPDLVWLNSMTVHGKTVSLSGEAMNTNAIAAFIENITLVPEFREPTPKNVRRGKGGRSYSFSLSFRFDPPKPAPEAAPGGDVAPAAAPVAATDNGAPPTS
jgi:type IV pilus assembly protein PilN